MKTTLYPFQKEGVEALLEMGGGLLADAPGLGKTLSALSFIEGLKHARPAVVVCPRSVKYQWQAMAAHEGVSVTVLGGRCRRSALARRKGIYAINYDVLDRWADALIDLGPKVVVLDESHYVKNREARRTKAAMALCAGVPHVLAMTGTPVMNRPMDLWPVLKILRPKLFPSWFRFGQAFGGARLTQWGWRFDGASNLDELHRQLKGVMIRRRKEDVLKDLPPKTVSVIPLEVGLKEYRACEEDFARWLVKNGRSPARSMKAEKLAQLTHLKHEAELSKVGAVSEWLRDYLDGASGKTILFCIHRDVVARYAEAFKGECVVVTGSQVGAAREQAVDQFRTNRRVRLMVGNLHAAGTGLNLQDRGDGRGGRSTVHAGLAWNRPPHEQGEDRVHRADTGVPTEAYYFVAAGTVEETIIEVIQGKQETADAVVDGSGGGGSARLHDLLCEQIMRKGAR